MKLYYKNDHPLVTKHKNLIRWAQNKTGITDYQLLWATFFKGVIIGAHSVVKRTEVPRSKGQRPGRSKVRDLAQLENYEGTSRSR